MIDCDDTRERLLNEILGAGPEEGEVEPHLADCLACREEALEIGRTADRIRRSLASWRTGAARLEVPRRRRRWIPLAAAGLILAGAAVWFLRPHPRTVGFAAAPEGLLLRVSDEGVRLSRAAAPPPASSGPIQPIPTSFTDLQIRNSGVLMCDGTIRCDRLTVSDSRIRINGDRLIVRGPWTVTEGAVDLRLREVYFASLRGTVTAGQGDSRGPEIRVPSGESLTISSPTACANLEIEPGGTLRLEGQGEILVTGRWINHGEIVWR